MTITEDRTSTHQVALSFEDGVTRFVTCKETQCVADASYRSRINIPVDCSDGACGTCKAFCESGEYDGGSYLDDALSPAESDEGYLLACQAKPRSDMVLQIATTSAVAKTSAATHTGTVTAVNRLSDTTVELRIEVAERGKLAFLPGQYVNIAVPGTEVTRSYSFANGPEHGELIFLVKISPGGKMSDYLTERAAEGDEIELTGPHGSFFLRESDAPLLLLAGGTGLAPILSILRTLDAAGSERPVHLVYGATTDDDVIELETLRDFAGDGLLTWEYCVADENTSAEHQGYVTTLIGPEHLHDGDAAVYLCGPPPMVEAVREFFSGNEFEPSGFYYEKFALAAVPEQMAGEKAEPEPQATAPDTDGLESGTEDPPAPETVVPVPSGDDGAEVLTLGGREGRELLGQPVTTFGSVEPLYSGGHPGKVGSDESAWRIIGQRVGAAFSTDGEEGALDDEDALEIHADARAMQTREILPVAQLEPLTPPAADPAAPRLGAPHPSQQVRHAGAECSSDPDRTDDVVGDDGYVIGEEHPSIHKSDAIFDARQGLELGALELVIGRLSTREIAGYRLLAESTVPYVDVEGERFTDAHAYTETNAAFHDYLFSLTGNEHLLRAYQALGVKGAMEETLRSAVWCHPNCAQDHLDIVDAIEAGDRDTARTLIIDHASNSKATMRRAMRDSAAVKRPRFVTPGRFDGQVVLVTGAAQGIGEATARRIGAEGGSLVLADRADLVHELATELGGVGVTRDLETWEGAQAAVTAAIERHGRIDVAIHTVGGTIWAKPFEHYPPEQIQAEINRSLWPTLWGCRAVAPHMIERGGGTIVNVSSVATRGLNRVPYAAAKGGVNAITSALALELAPHGIRVVATAPGGTDAPERRIPRGPAPESDTEKDWYATIVDQTTESSLLKRYGTQDEQAAVLCFLASQEASYITATVLPVAGGDLG